MKPLFSQRHKESVFAKEKNFLKEKLPLTPRLRQLIARVLDDYNDCEERQDENGWHLVNIIGEANNYLQKWVGPGAFTLYRKEKQVVNFLDVIKLGYPSQVFDCIEAWFFLFIFSRTNKGS